MPTVALVEDHRLFSSALTVALEAQAVEAVEIINPETRSLTDVRAALARVSPDVLLLDLDLGGLGSGADLISGAVAGGAKVVMMSATRDELAIGQCLDLGAHDWVPKRSALDTLLAAVIAALDGNRLLDPDERHQLIDAWRRRQADEALTRAALERLTKRESYVLGQLMAGVGVEQIAADLFLSDQTVRGHVRSVLVRLGVRSQLQAVAVAARVGWSPPARPGTGASIQGPSLT